MKTKEAEIRAKEIEEKIRLKDETLGVLYQETVLKVIKMLNEDVHLMKSEDAIKKINEII